MLCDSWLSLGNVTWLFHRAMPGLRNACTEQRASPKTAGFSVGQCLVCTMLQNTGHLQGQLAFPKDNAWSVHHYRTEGISKDSWLFQWTMPGLYITTNRGHLQGQLAFPMDNTWSVHHYRTEGISGDRSFLGAKSGLNNTNREQGASQRTDGISTEMTLQNFLWVGCFRALPSWAHHTRTVTLKSMVPSSSTVNQSWPL